MRTIQNYRAIFSEIGSNLRISGDSLEVLVQLLAQATYISEVEQISYVQEASLEKASLINSKIQHCMDLMYSVWRGSCPRLILNIKPMRVFNFKPYDPIISSNNFKVYYLGYWDPKSITSETTRTVHTYAFVEISELPLGASWIDVTQSEWEKIIPSSTTAGNYYRVYSGKEYWKGCVRYIPEAVESIPSDIPESKIYKTITWPIDLEGFSDSDRPEYIVYIKYRYYIAQQDDNGQFYFQEYSQWPESVVTKNFVQTLPTSQEEIAAAWTSNNSIGYATTDSRLYYQVVVEPYWEEIEKSESYDYQYENSLPDPSIELKDSIAEVILVVGKKCVKDTTTEIPELTDTSLLGGFVFGETSLLPSDTPTPILGLIAKETYEMEKTLTSSNPYYVETMEEDLSNDVLVEYAGEVKPVTRNFSDHILDGDVFDLTLPSFGSRLFVNPGENEISTINETLSAKYFKYSELDSYNTSELAKLYVKGAELVSFDSCYTSTDPTWDVFKGQEEFGPGIIGIKEGSRDSLVSIHYKANRDRYDNSILRSNADVTSILEEDYADYIVSSGTSYKFTYNASSGTTGLFIWYVPKNRNNLLPESKIEQYRDKRSSYYITTDITIEPGEMMNVIYNLEIELYTTSDTEDLTVALEKIFDQYENKFNVDLIASQETIKSSISKISNVSQIKGIEILWLDENGEPADQPKDLTYTYFEISFNLNTTVKSIII